MTQEIGSTYLHEYTRYDAGATVTAYPFKDKNYVFLIASHTF